MYINNLNEDDNKVKFSSTKRKGDFLQYKALLKEREAD